MLDDWQGMLVYLCLYLYFFWRKPDFDGWYGLIPKWAAANLGKHPSQDYRGAPNAYLPPQVILRFHIYPRSNTFFTLRQKHFAITFCKYTHARNMRRTQCLSTTSSHTSTSILELRLPGESCVFNKFWSICWTEKLAFSKFLTAHLSHLFLMPARVGCKYANQENLHQIVKRFWRAARTFAFSGKPVLLSSSNVSL